MRFHDDDKTDIYSVIEFIKEEIKQQEKKREDYRSAHLFYSNNNSAPAAKETSPYYAMLQYGTDSAINILNKLVEDLNNEHSDYLFSKERIEECYALDDLDIAQNG